MPDVPYEGVVVLGSPRSGTTLIRRLLSAHPSLHCPAETYLLTAASRFLHNDPFAAGLSAGPMAGLLFAGYEEDQVLTRLREFVFGFFREIAAGAGKPIWVEKTGVDAFHAEEIDRICGDSVRYICIQRHGVDVACSMEELSSKMQAYLTELHRYIALHTVPMIAFAHAWVDANERLLALAARRPAQCLTLRYEDLLDDPRRELGRIFGFLGLDAETDRIVEAGLGGDPAVGLGDWKVYEERTLRKASVGRADKLDPSIRAALAPIVNPMLQRLGYDPIDEEAPDSLSDACRAFQLNQMVLRMRVAKKAAAQSQEK